MSRRLAARTVRFVALPVGVAALRTPEGLLVLVPGVDGTSTERRRRAQAARAYFASPGRS